MLSVALLIAESFLTLLLKFNKPLRNRLAPLVSEESCIRVSTYLPHYEFFVSFTDKGILFDKELPETIVEPSVLVSGSTLNLSRILLTGDEQLLRKIQLKGNKKDIALLQDCLENIGVQNVLQDVFENIKQIDPEESKAKQATINHIESQVSEQESEILSLNQSLLSSQIHANKLKKQLILSVIAGASLLFGLICTLIYIFVL